MSKIFHYLFIALITVSASTTFFKTYCEMPLETIDFDDPDEK